MESRRVKDTDTGRRRWAEDLAGVNLGVRVIQLLTRH